MKFASYLDLKLELNRKIFNMVDDLYIYIKKIIFFLFNFIMKNMKKIKYN